MRNTSAPSSTRPKPAQARTYRSRSGDERRAERRAKFLAAAIALYGSAGYHATSVKSICQQAGLTERYFYESFANSEALLEAAFLEISSATLTQALATATASEQGAVETMGMVLTYYLGQLKANPERARLVLIEAEGVSPHMDAVYRQVLDQITDLIRLVVAKELSTKPAQGLSAELLCSAYLGALYQLFKLWGLGGFKTSIPVLVKNAQAVFRGILREWQGS